MAGSSPSKPKMSAGEKANHAAAAAEWDHYKSTYVPLEGEYLSDSQKDFTARGQAQADSAVMREGTDNLRLSALSGGTSSSAGALGDALTGARTSATAEAQQKRDGRMAGALGIGRELATDTSSSLSALGRTGARESINKMQSDLKADTARNAAVAQGLGTLGGAAYSKYSGGQTSGTGKFWSRKGGTTTAQRVPESIF